MKINHKRVRSLKKPESDPLISPEKGFGFVPTKRCDGDGWRPQGNPRCNWTHCGSEMPFSFVVRKQLGHRQEKTKNSQ